MATQERSRRWSRRRRGPARTPTLTREQAARLNERFMSLDRRQRREITRAVNRGVPMQDRRMAELAIGVAQRQQRFWRYAWLLGPSIALVQAAFSPLTVTEVLLLALWGSVVLGAMAWWWYSRAVKAELANAQVAQKGRIAPTPGRRAGQDAAAGRTSADGSGVKRRSRLPGGPAVPVPTADDHAFDEDAGEQGDLWAPAAPRPPRPRGRKRR